MGTPGSLDRSTLDSKDRNELTTIAKAMGGKPPSRARKADIIDLILQMAGGNDDAADAGSDDAGESNNSNGEQSHDGDAGDAGDDASDDDAGASDGDHADDVDGDDSDSDDSGDDDSGDNDGSDNDGGDNAGSGRGRTRRSGRTEDSDRSQNDGGRNRGDNNRGDNNDRSKNDRSRNDRSQNDRSQNEGGRSDSNSDQNDGGDQGRKRNEQPEPGNRRRRRRGRSNGESDDQWNGQPQEVSGHLDLRDDGYGFLRVDGAMPSTGDVYVPVKQVRELSLRPGDHVIGTSRPANRNEKNPALLSVEAVNGRDPAEARNRPNFDDLTPLFPDENLRLERRREKHNMTTRIIDLIAPIGKGQRGLIVSPPKAGKTTIMKEIIRSIEMNNPEVKLLVLLVDERPEEVTDMKRWMERGEVIASTFDKPTEHHTAVAELTIERAKRLVEMGDDVVIILDGITRLARAYNIAAPQGGRVMSGGVDAGALYPPKKFFGAARNIEEGGSLTILASALVETGSKMDEVIFEEFKGTGNMELRLDRRTAERRVYPAIDVDGSSTRHEELLFTPKQLQQVWKLRKVLQGLADEEGGRGNAAGLSLLIDRLGTFATNDEFLNEIAKGVS